MRVVYSDAADKQLSKLERPVADRIRRAIALLEREPWPGAVRSYRGDQHRLRVGDYRAIFGRHGDEVHVYRIGHRREVYEADRR